MSKRNSTALVPAGASSAAMALPAVGNLDAYIAAVNRLPMLSPERETELGRRIRDNTDLEAAREMVMSHLRLVVSISRQPPWMSTLSMRSPDAMRWLSRSVR